MWQKVKIKTFKPKSLNLLRRSVVTNSSSLCFQLLTSAHSAELSETLMKPKVWRDPELNSQQSNWLLKWLKSTDRSPADVLENSPQLRVQVLSDFKLACNLDTIYIHPGTIIFDNRICHSDFCFQSQ